MFKIVEKTLISRKINQVGLVASIIALFSLLLPMFGNGNLLPEGVASFVAVNPFTSKLMAFFLAGGILITLLEKNMAGLFAMGALTSVIVWSFTTALITRTAYGYAEVYNNYVFIFLGSLSAMMIIGLFDFFTYKRNRILSIESD